MQSQVVTKEHGDTPSNRTQTYQHVFLMRYDFYEKFRQDKDYFIQKHILPGSFRIVKQSYSYCLIYTCVSKRQVDEILVKRLFYYAECILNISQTVEKNNGSLGREVLAWMRL